MFLCKNHMQNTPIGTLFQLNECFHQNQTVRNSPQRCNAKIQIQEFRWRKLSLVNSFTIFHWLEVRKAWEWKNLILAHCIDMYIERGLNSNTIHDTYKRNCTLDEATFVDNSQRFLNETTFELFTVPHVVKMRVDYHVEPRGHLHRTSVVVLLVESSVDLQSAHSLPKWKTFLLIPLMQWPVPLPRNKWLLSSHTIHCWRFPSLMDCTL